MKPLSRVFRASGWPPRFDVLRLAALVAAIACALCVAACDTETPTSAVVDDAYPAIPDGGDPASGVVVFKVWWQATAFLDPVAAGSESDVQRTVPTSDYAYAILAPGWDPASTTPPAVLIAVRSNDKLAVARGDTLHITVSDATFTGNCAAGKPLAQSDVDFISISAMALRALIINCSPACVRSTFRVVRWPRTGARVRPRRGQRTSGR